ncbi:MAG: HIT family protein [Candidatus Altiarchaeota archaeon]
MDDCIFCKIIKGDIPGRIIAENDEYMAFLDIQPVALGHSLVVPKKHYKDLLEFERKKGGGLFAFIQEVSSRVIKATGSEGFNVWMNNGRSAGQLVNHLHFHIIPRKGGDFSYKVEKLKLTEEEMEEVQQKILNS